MINRMMLVQEVTDVVIGPHPLDEDDLRADIVEATLRKHFGEETRIKACLEDIMTRLDNYERHKLDGAYHAAS